MAIPSEPSSRRTSPLGMGHLDNFEVIQSIAERFAVANGMWIYNDLTKNASAMLDVGAHMDEQPPPAFSGSDGMLLEEFVTLSGLTGERP